MGTGPVEGDQLVIQNFDELGHALVRFDVDGNPLDAHGGEIRRFGNLYYLYGETYACGYQWLLQRPNPFCGFRVYSSPDLASWTDHGLLFEVKEGPWQSRCHWWTSGCFRPHVLFNAETQRYVLWVNSYANPVNYYVLESESPVGPFLETGAPRLAINGDGDAGKTNNGDQNLFLDDDGKAFVIYTDWRTGRGDIIVEELTTDFLQGTGNYVRLGTEGSESPSMFRRGDRYYITASVPPNGGYATSSTAYFTAVSPLGPWSRPRRISQRSCGGQPFHVSRLPSAGGESWYLYQSDLWLGGDIPPGDGNQAPAGLYWEPLRFKRDGSIRDIRCLPLARVPSLNAGSTTEAWRLKCDIGPTANGNIERKISAVVGEQAGVNTLLINLYQRDEPDASLAVTVRRTGAGEAVIGRRTFSPKSEDWLDTPEILWTARKLSIPLETSLQTGDSVSIHLSTDARKGCFGIALRADLPATGDQSWQKVGSGPWRLEAGTQIRYEFEPAAALGRG